MAENFILTENSVVGIIGGKGAMGNLFAEFFREKGFRIMISDQNSGFTNEQLIARSDIVIFSVPLHKTEQIIRETAPRCRRNQLLMDLSSLKSAPMREMMKSPADVIGLHPMFGPGIRSFWGQTIVLCRGRVSEETAVSVKRLFEESGIRVKESSAEKHDQMMSVIQVLTHFSTIIMGRTIRELGMDIRESLEYTSPIYRLEMNFISRLFAQDPELYGAMAMQNPHTEKALEELLRSFEKYKNLISSKNLSDYVEDFRRTSEFFGEFSREAMETSNRILDYLINDKK